MPKNRTSIKAFSPQENLLRVMNLPLSKFDGVIRTSDGFYIAREKGDLGYNAFLGNPAPVHEGPGLTNTRKIWKSLTVKERQRVRALAAHPTDGLPIILSAFGVPNE